MDDADISSRLRRIERRVTWIGETLIQGGAVAVGIAAFVGLRDVIPGWAALLSSAALWLVLVIGLTREFRRDW
jgi:hypothetical protein